MIATLRTRPGSADVRALTGAALFWLSALAVGGMTFAVLALLSSHLPAGGLAAVSAVLGLSYVLAVPPGAIQLRAAATAASPRHELGLTPPKPVLISAVALVAASPLLARALELPTAAVALAGVQLPLAAALASGRGTLIGRGQLRSAAASLQIDAACRLCAGVALGIVWGASGVAAALVLATLLPLLGVRRGLSPSASAPDRRPTASPASEGSTLSYLLAMSTITLLTNLDVLLGPRVLDHAADRYAVASLPAKGIFFALFAISWVSVPFAVNAPTRREVLKPAAATLGLGVVGAGAVLVGRPLLPLLFGHGEPAIWVLAPLAAAMACAGTTGVVIAMAVARGARRAWAGPLAAALVLAAVALLLRPDARGLALDVLTAQLLALGSSVWALLRPSRAVDVEAASAATALAGPTLAEPAGLVVEAPRPPEELCARPREPSPSPLAGASVEPAFPRRALLAACGLITTACFTQAPGRIVADTKLDLYVEPLRFLSRALQLWDPSAAFGQVQDQAVGYLFPMGPFFAATHGAGIPAWVAQRLWMALLLSLAAWGTARLARALRIGSPATWVLGGLAYALSPFFIGQLASSSVGLLAGALVPWSVLPLVAAARRGGSRRRAAGLSGLAVLAMGGVNAACTIAVLPLPALYILTRRASRARTSLLGWWVLAVGMACFWWAAALMLQGRLGFDFIRFTETGATTQSTTSAFETLRGAGNWVAYLDLGHPWLPAGWILGTAPAAILATAGVAAAGLAGLALPRQPERGFLVGAFALGVVCVGAGYAGPAAGVAGPQVQALLSGALGPLRNTYKFEPLISLPLALGLMHLLGVPRIPRLRVALWAAVAACVLVGLLPFAQGRLASEGSPRAVPAYWYRLAGYLDRHAGRGRTLLLPSSAFGEYQWGRPLDEPLESLAQTPWAVRSLIPLGGVGSTQMLDAIEAEIVDGHVSAHLDQVLARAGISFVVARNDLAWQHAEEPPPAEVSEALRAGGLRPVAAFGPNVPSELGVDVLGLPAAKTRAPSLEVYAVRGASPVATYPEVDPVVLDGGPQSLVQLAGAPWMASRAAVLSGDMPANSRFSGDLWVVSDASRRAAEDFGLVESNYSYTLAAGAQVPGGQAEGLQLAPPVPGAGQATAVYGGGIASVSASSYGSWLLQLPELAPANAFDGNPATAWVAGNPTRSQGQWVQANLARPRSVSEISVRLLQDGPWRPLVRALTVTTAAGSRTSPVVDTQTLQAIPAAPGATTFVRVTLADVTGQTPAGADAGLRDVVIPGVPATVGSAEVYVRPPEDPALLRSGAIPSFALTRQTANPGNLLRSDPEADFARLVQLPRATAMRLTGAVLPVPGTGLDALLSQTRGLTISASSSWGRLPGWRAANAVDGDPDSAWVAAPPVPLAPRTPPAPGVGGAADVNIAPRSAGLPTSVDPHPALYLSWHGQRTLDALRVVPAGAFAAPPTMLALTALAGTRLVAVPKRGGVVHFAALRTDRLTITFPGVAARYAPAPDGTRVRLPVGVADLDFPALRELAPVPLASRTVIRLPCGEGPPVVIDGRRFATSVTGTVAAISDLAPLPFSLCTTDQAVAMSTGSNSIFSPAGDRFALTDVAITPVRQATAPAPAPRKVSIVSWAPDTRRLRLGPGPATYLAVRENFNSGWNATLDGHHLSAIRLDGWQQGFVVPAGRAGAVELSYSANGAYQLILILGAALALGLLAFALVPGRRFAADALAPAGRPGRLLRALAVAGATIALALVSWPAVAVFGALVLVGRRDPALLAPVAGLALVAAAALVAVGVSPVPADHAGAFGAPAQILAATAIAAVLATLALPAGRVSPRRRS